MTTANLSESIDVRISGFLRTLDAYRERAAPLRAGYFETIHGTHAARAPVLAEIAARFIALVDALDLEVLDEQLLGVLLAAELCVEVRDLASGDTTVGAPPWLQLGSAAQLLGSGPGFVAELANRLDAKLPLRSYALVETHTHVPSGGLPLAGWRLKLDSEVVDRVVLGSTALAGADDLEGPVFADDQAWARLHARVEAAAMASQTLLVEIAGAEGTGRRAVAADLALAAGATGLVVKTLRAGANRAQAARVLAALRRDARLQGGLACLVQTAAEPLADPRRPDDESAGAGLAEVGNNDALIQALRGFAESIVLVAVDPIRGLEACGLRLARMVTHFPRPAERARFLESAIRAAGATVAPGVDLWQIGRRYALDGRRLSAAVRGALDECALRTQGSEANEASEASALSFEDLQSGCRRQVRDELFDLATRVTAHHQWGDMVVEREVLEGLGEMTDTVRCAQHVYEQWGFGKHHSLAQGVTALFTGPPGTGKTMCAAVVARELDMELFRVDLSRVVSKWIGETQKNLGRIFDAAERSHAIILFDEADSLFARRTDVKSSVDRHANSEVNYLLQRMEAFSGVTILTSNYEDTIDAAFKRRLNFKLRFEKPNAQGRALLWRKVFPAGAPLAPDFDPVQLAERFEMSGANIRNAAVRAGFLASAADARSITQAHCMEAAEREAREMGVLTRSAAPPHDPDEPEPPASATPPSGNGDGKPPPRLVPVTHPRRR